jgi:hypothetical protein
VISGRVILEILSLNKYLYANGNAINAIDPSGMFTLGEVALALGLLSVAGATAYFSFPFSSKYVYSPATVYEKKHRSQAVTISQFLSYLHGKTEKQVYGNLTYSSSNSGFGIIIPYYEGPPDTPNNTINYRYVEDPIDPDRAIDMVHFINFGMNPLFAWPKEIQQGNEDSAWILEDLRSNYFGEIFYRGYYTFGASLESAFSRLYNDISSGKVEFRYNQFRWWG